MATSYNAPYKVLQRKARAHKKFRGKVLWTSCTLDRGTGGGWIKVPAQGTYRRDKEQSA